MFFQIPGAIITQILLISSTLFSANKWFDDFLNRCSFAFNCVFTDNIYMFFENYAEPFPARNLHLESPQLAPPVFAYNADTYVFYEYLRGRTYRKIVEENRSKPISVLSLEIIDANSEVVFDLTHFIGLMRTINVQPKICHIVSAWTAGSWVVLDKSRYKVRYIAEDCNTHVVPLDDSNLL